jgi:hypothetical protein
LRDGCLTLADGATQDLQHLGAASRAGGDERCIWRMQLLADRLGIRHTLGREAITVIVGVPAQLDVPHGPSLPDFGGVMLELLAQRMGLLH